MKKELTHTKDFDLTFEIFVSKVKEDISQFKILEGDGGKFLTLEECRKLKMAPIIDKLALDKLEEYFAW